MKRALGIPLATLALLTGLGTGAGLAEPRSYLGDRPVSGVPGSAHPDISAGTARPGSGSELSTVPQDRPLLPGPALHVVPQFGYSDRGADFIAAIIFMKPDMPFEPADPGGGVCSVFGCPTMSLHALSSTVLRAPFSLPEAAALMPLSGGTAEEVGRPDADLNTEPGKCTNVFGFTDAHLRDLCASTQEDRKLLSACSQSVKNIMEFRQTKRDADGELAPAPYSSDNLRIYARRGLSWTEGHALESKITGNYLRFCLEEFFDLELTSADRPEFWNALSRSVGTFFHANTFAPLCSGFFTEGFLVTARHCFRDHTVRDIPRELNRIIFVTLSGEVYRGLGGRDLIVTPYYANGGTWEEKLTTDDLIAISADNFQPRPQFLMRGRPAHGERLMMLGHFNEIETYGTQNAHRSTHGYSQSVGLDRTVSCRAFEVSGNGCIAHSCQSAFGLSGSPLLKYYGEMPVVVGMHSRAISRQPTAVCGRVHKDTAAPNMAIPLDPLFPENSSETTEVSR